MIIYQLHEYSGQWEDFTDSIIGSYLHKEKAKRALIKACEEEKELREQSKKCNNCPLSNGEFSSCEQVKEYCSKAKLQEYEDGDIDCDNFYLQWDVSEFEIKEVEVEE